MTKTHLFLTERCVCQLEEQLHEHEQSDKPAERDGKEDGDRTFVIA